MLDADLLVSLTATRPGTVVAELTRLCREIAESLELPRVALQLAEGPQAQWPITAEPSRWAPRTVRLEAGGEPVGLLSVAAGPLRRPGGRADRVLAELVDVLSPVLPGLRLQAQLEAQLASAHAHAERIAAARRQAFAERDQERRDLERDLHDGAQHHLVALKMVVGLLELQLGNGDRAGAGAGLTRLRSGLEATEQTLLTTAAGICPPVLVERGIVAALSAEFRELGPAVQVQANLSARRLPLLHETAVYFTCLEAVNNARKHAPGAQVIVRLQENSEGLAFAVSDNGPGLDRADPVDSFGLGNMRARIEAAGGRLELYTAPGAGTTVHGLIPV